MRRSRHLVLPLLGLALLASVPLLAAATESASAVGPPEVFDGRVVDAAGALPRASTAFFTLHVNRYTTDEELNGYLAILHDQGEDALRSALEKAEVGFIKIANSLGYPIAVAR